MSHWRKFQNNVLKNTDVKLLEKALNNLGLGLDLDTKTIKNAYGKDQVDMAIVKDGRVISLGFKRNDEGVLEFKGDPWGTGVNQEQLLNQIAQQYNKESIVEKLKKTSQYSVTDVKNTETGEIEIMVACM